MRRRWRDYRTATGRRPAKQFLDKLNDGDVAAVMAAMREVKTKGLVSARHLEGNVYEVRARGDRAIYRVLFAPQGKHGQVLLALEAFNKKSRKTPPQTLRLAKQRLRDWERRGRGVSIPFLVSWF